MLLLVAGLSLGYGPAAAAETNLDRLAWLEGTWVGVANGVAMEETWSSPAGGGVLRDRTHGPPSGVREPAA